MAWSIGRSSNTPRRRPGDALIADLHAVVTQLEAGTAIDEEFLAEMSSAATAGEWTRLQRACYDRLSPTRLSYRIWWQLDELDPVLAGPLVNGIPGPTKMLLRGGFNGGYQRHAQLMWVA